mmetsp:Transcript_75070/g.219948  ORF Transcript_75070/g.219948 Transcript_75070/m.219948 type:complete len:253 (+) Transcript_75070:42-800(+)
MPAARHLPACLLPFYGVGAFCSRPKLWKYAVIPGCIFAVFTIWVASMIFTVGLAAQVFLGPLAIGAVIFEFIAINKSVMIFVFQKMQRFITRAALEERGVYDELCSSYGAEKVGELGCCRNMQYNMCFAVWRVLILWAVGVLPSVTVLVPPVAAALLWLLLFAYFGLYTWNLVSESLGRMMICSCHQQLDFALAHKGSFLSFGAVAMILETLPIVNFVFMAGNAFGAAVLFERYFEEQTARGHPNARLIAKA